MVSTSSGCRSDPLTLDGVRELSAGRHAVSRKLVDWIAFYLSFELDWDVRLILKHDEVPPLTLDRTRRLGWTTWLGARRTSRDADDLCLHPETVCGGAGVSV